jgi:hypothetical protein
MERAERKEWKGGNGKEAARGRSKEEGAGTFRSLKRPAQNPAFRPGPLRAIIACLKPATQLFA